MKRHQFAVQVRPRNQQWEAARARIAHFSRAQAEDWINSVLVEGHDCRWYSVRKEQGVSCSCRTQPVDVGGPTSDEALMGRGAEDNSRAGPDISSQSFTIRPANPFAHIPEERVRDELEPQDFGEQEGPIYGENFNFLETTEGEGIDCAVCFRIGMLPAYEMAHGTRLCLTTLSPATLTGSTVIQRAAAPDYFEIHSVTGASVSFPIVVPKYTRSIRAAVFMDREIVARPTVANVAGTANLVVNSVPEFTHVVVEFDMDSRPIRVSIPQLTKISDSSLYLKHPVQNVVVGAQVNAQTGDLIWLPKLELVLRVTEVRPIKVLDGVLVGQEVTARLVQPLETLSILPLE